MNLLAIDTTTDLASIALTVDGHCYSQEQLGARTHAYDILPIVIELLAQANIELRHLHGIIFGCGPGSFTGIRVACSIAKGLAYGLNLALYPVSSLHAVATFVRRNVAPSAAVLSMIDARMHQVYWSYSTINSVTDECVNNVENITLPINVDNKFYLAGIGWENYIQKLPQVLKENVIDYVSVHPQAEVMIYMVMNFMVKSVDIANALPIYVRNKIA